MDRATRVKTTRLYNFLSAMFAFTLWGGWAYYVNSGHGEAVQRSALLTQGSASFVITLIMTRSVSLLFSLLTDNRFRAIVPAVVTVFVTGTCLIALHHQAGTPEVTATVTPALSVAFFYCLYTTYKLQRQVERSRGGQL